jgi:hypothetical protein
MTKREGKAEVIESDKAALMGRNVAEGLQVVMRFFTEI